VSEELIDMQLVDDFINAKRVAGRANGTLAYYRRTIILLIETIGVSYREMTASDIRIFLAYYKTERRCKNSTLSTIQYVLVTFFAWLEKEEYIDKSPARKLDTIKVEKILRLPFSPAEVDALRGATDNLRDRAIIDLFLISAVRVSELCSIDKEDIDFANLEFVVLGKGSKERKCYLDGRSAASIQEYLASRPSEDECEALFATIKKPYRRLDRHCVETIISSVSDAAGVTRAHPHRFRRTAATTALRNGMPVEQVKEMLGHSSVETTMRYVTIAEESVKHSHGEFLAGKI
jgi:integrase/recombinase XerD